MKAWTLKPLNPEVESVLREKVDPQDPELVKARIKVEWKNGVMHVRHPNFKWVIGKQMRAEALDNARREAVKMLPEFTIEEDYEVNVV